MRALRIRAGEIEVKGREWVHRDRAGEKRRAGEEECSPIFLQKYVELRAWCRRTLQLARKPEGVVAKLNNAVGNQAFIRFKFPTVRTVVMPQSRHTGMTDPMTGPSW